MERNGVYGAFFVLCIASPVISYLFVLTCSYAFHPHTHIFGRGCPTFTLLGPWPNLNSISERWWPTGARRPGWKKSSHFSQLAVKQTSLQWEFGKKFSSKHFLFCVWRNKNVFDFNWNALGKASGDLTRWQHMLRTQFTINLKCQCGPGLWFEEDL